MYPIPDSNIFGLLLSNKEGKTKLSINIQRYLRSFPIYR